MRSRTFLSIDIDFWNNRKNKIQSLNRYLNKIYRLCDEYRIPLLAVTNHQQMLPLVNNSEATQLLNIDRHSDLAQSDVGELNCGTWVSYVKWRRNGTYRWIHTGFTHEGDCNGSRPIFLDNSKSRKKLTDWKNISHQRTRSLPNLRKNITKIKYVSVCLSPSYSDDELQDVFKQWVKRYKIKFLRGRKREYFGRKVRP